MGASEASGRRSRSAPGDRMPFHVDFRDDYGSIIDGWLGGGGSEVLGRPVQDLSSFARGPGVAAMTVPTAVPVVVPPAAGGARGVIATTGQFLALSPIRICDTRNGVDGLRTPLGPGETMAVQIAGVGSARRRCRGGRRQRHLGQCDTAHVPDGLPERHTTSLLVDADLVPGRAVANTTMVGVGADGRIAIFNPFGALDCIVDVMGYFRPEPSTCLVPLVPSRPPRHAERDRRAPRTRAWARDDRPAGDRARWCA